MRAGLSIPNVWHFILKVGYLSGSSKSLLFISDNQVQLLSCMTDINWIWGNFPSRDSLLGLIKFLSIYLIFISIYLFILSWILMIFFLLKPDCNLTKAHQAQNSTLKRIYSHEPDLGRITYPAAGSASSRSSWLVNSGHGFRLSRPYARRFATNQKLFLKGFAVNAKKHANELSPGCWRGLLNVWVKEGKKEGKERRK